MESNIYYGSNANANNYFGGNSGFASNNQATTGNPQAVNGEMAPAVISKQSDDMTRQLFEESLASYCENEDTDTYLEWIDSFMSLLVREYRFYVPVIQRPLSDEVRIYCPLYDALDRALPDKQPLILRPVEWEYTCYPIYTRTADLYKDFPYSFCTSLTFPDIYQQYMFSGGLVYTMGMTVGDDCIYLTDRDVDAIFSILRQPATVCHTSDGEEFLY